MCAGALRHSVLPLLVILVFGAVFEDTGELCVVEVALLVNGGLTEQLVHIFVCEAVAHGGQQLPQMVLVDHTLDTVNTHQVPNSDSKSASVCVDSIFCLCRLTRSLLIETGEGVADDVFRVCSVEPFSKHGEEHGEVDGPRCFAHHPLQVFIRRVLT